VGFPEAGKGVFEKIIVSRRQKTVYFGAAVVYKVRFRCPEDGRQFMV
jgi:hypothetical protein